jgi:hypothetical protein
MREIYSSLFTQRYFQSKEDIHSKNSPPGLVVAIDYSILARLGKGWAASPVYQRKTPLKGNWKFRYHVDTRYLISMW